MIPLFWLQLVSQFGHSLNLFDMWLVEGMGLKTVEDDIELIP